MAEKEFTGARDTKRRKRGERGRERERERKRERAKRGRPDDELAEMTSRAKSLR